MNLPMLRHSQGRNSELACQSRVPQCATKALLAATSSLDV